MAEGYAALPSRSAPLHMQLASGALQGTTLLCGRQAGLEAVSPQEELRCMCNLKLANDT